MKNQKTLPKHRYTSPSIVIGALVAGLLLFFANTASWVNKQVFDTTNFTATAKSALLSSSSRDALASEIVGKALADRPVIDRVAGDTLTRMISGLLGSDQFAKVFDVAISHAQSYLISSNQKTIAFDLSGIKQPVERVIIAIGDTTENPDLNGQRISQIPDQIVLIDSDKVPDLYKLSVAFYVAGPILLVIALVILAIPYIKRPVKWAYILICQGIAVLLSGVFALIIGPFARPPILSLMPDDNIRTVVANVYNAFIATFNAQSWWLVWAGIVAIVVGVLVTFWPKIRALYKIVRNEIRDARKNHRQAKKHTAKS